MNCISAKESKSPKLTQDEMKNLNKPIPRKERNWTDYQKPHKGSLGWDGATGESWQIFKEWAFDSSFNLIKCRRGRTGSQWTSEAILLKQSKTSEQKTTYQYSRHTYRNLKWRHCGTSRTSWDDQKNWQVLLKATVGNSMQFFRKFHPWLYNQEMCSSKTTTKHNENSTEDGNNPKTQTNGQIMKRWCSHTIDWFPTMKRNEVLVQAATWWMNLES